MLSQNQKQTIGNRIKSIRKNLQFTQKDLADRLGITLSAVSSYETGQRCPSTETLINLSALFGVSVDFILYGPRENKEMELVPDLVPIHISRTNKKGYALIFD